MLNLYSIPSLCTILSKNLDRPTLFYTDRDNYRYNVNRFTSIGSRMGYKVKTQQVMIITDADTIPSIAIKVTFSYKDN